MPVFQDERTVVETDHGEHRVAVTLKRYTADGGDFRLPTVYRLRVSHTSPHGGLVDVLYEGWVGSDKTEAIYTAIDHLEDRSYDSVVGETVAEWDEEA